MGKLTEQQTAIGVLPRAWIEAYEDFTADMEEMGLTFDCLPSWSAGVPVRAIALPMGVLLLSKATRKELRHYQKMRDSGGEVWLSDAPYRTLATMHKATIIAIDPVKVQAWQRKNGYETIAHD